jgi:mannitol/fructose-specific phosphotransferase system IIA component
MKRRDDNAAATLARLHAQQLARARRWRAKAALIIGSVALDAEHVRALKTIQKALRTPSRVAAIRAAIMRTAEAIDRSKHHE